VRLVKKVSTFDHFALMVCVTFDCHLLYTVKTLPYMLKHQQFASYPEFTLHILPDILWCCFNICALSNGPAKVRTNLGPFSRLIVTVQVT